MLIGKKPSYLYMHFLSKNDERPAQIFYRLNDGL